VLAAALLLVASLTPTDAMAQRLDVGTIVVRAIDPSGGMLPGVAVALTGPQAAQTAVTTADGTARFRGLIPGAYDLTLALDGFATLIRREIRSSAGQTTTVRAPMELSAVEETVTVVGQSPLIDVTQVQVGATVSEQLLNRTPTASGLWSGVLDRIPGVVNAKIDVGGADSGQQSRITSHGSLNGQNQFNLNGSSTGNHGIPGGSAMYYSIGSFEEVAVSTSAHDVEVQAPGVSINMVSKSGSNELRGTARMDYSSGSLVGNNIDTDLEEAGVQQGNPLTLLTDLNLQVGGPLVRDKLFTFVDFWNFKTNRLIEGVPPDEPDDTRLRAFTVNTTWQINQDHRFSARYFNSHKFRGNRFTSVNRPPESALVQDPSSSNTVQVHWQGVLSPVSYADIRVSHRWGGFALTGRRPDTANPHPDYPAGQFFTQDLGLGTFSGMPYESAQSDRLQQIGGNLSHYIAGERSSHDLKFGGAAWKGTNWLTESVIGGVWQYKIDGEPFAVDLDNTTQRDVRDADAETSALSAGKAWSLYLQDTIALGDRLTLDLGLRYDQSRSSTPAQRRLDSTWAGIIPDENFGQLYNAQEFAEVDPVVAFNDLVPRVAVLFDISGRGTTVVQANYARYSLQQGSVFALSTNLNLTGWSTYFWNDNDGDGQFQAGEQGDLLSANFPGVTSTFDPDFRSPVQEEITFGIEQQVDRNLSVGGTFIYHNTLHQMESINTGVPYGSVAERLGVEDSYTPVAWADPGPDGIPGTPDDGGPITVYNQDPATFGQDFYLVTNVDKWGLDAPVRYKGVELTARRRFADGWQAMASWTIGTSTSGLGKSVGGIGGARTGGVFDNPNADINRFGITDDDRRHIVKVTGNYMFRSIGVNLGANFRYESGRPALREIRTPRGMLNQGSIRVAAAGRGEDTNEFSIGRRLGDVVILDLRAEKEFDLPGRWGRLSLYLDAFNLTNENAVRSATQTSGQAYRRINLIVPPRMLRLGGGWFF